MQFFGINPGRRLVVYFAVAIIIGSIFLVLPWSSGAKRISYIDALFTSTSAVCVTGLAVMDTGHDFSLFGQIIILILIQLGGLGIMTFATVLLIAFGARLSFYNKMGLTESFMADQGYKVYSLLKAIFTTTFIFEFIGAALLFVSFQASYPLDKALYFSIFHAVSAFCNAGFSTFSGSLENYRDNSFVLLVMAGLIISGGLGFVVVREILNKLKDSGYKLSLHSKLCISGSLILLILGTIAFLIFEDRNVFKGVAILKSVANAFFQSTTSRTAGFNSIPQAKLTEISLMITMVLMFIGACPGSTGGGIKITTISIILVLVYKRFKGYQAVNVFNSTINGETITRAITVFILASLTVIILLMIFMFAEEIPGSHQAVHGWLGECLFEVLSAFGTVGLSLGMTPHLHTGGKLILILTMFIGRVGLLTLAFALARPLKRGEIIYAEESVLTG